MDWVMDCSFTAALFLPDQSSPEVHEFFSSLEDDVDLWVPTLWWYETTNVLSIAERKGFINRADISKILSLYSKLALKTDDSHGIQYAASVYDITGKYQLSAYDAAYLELALRRGAKLASLDRQLLSAAAKSGVTTSQRA